MFRQICIAVDYFTFSSIMLRHFELKFLIGIAKVLTIPYHIKPAEKASAKR